MLLPAALGGEAPEGKYGAGVLLVGLLGGVFVVLVVFELLFVCVLHDHAFHDLECALHRCGVEGVLDLDLLLNSGFLVFLVLHLLLELLAEQFLVGGHVGVEDLPLCGLEGEVGALGRVSLDTLLAEGQVEGLAGAFLEVELVAQRLLLGALVALQRVLPELLLDRNVHLVQQTLVALDLVLPVLLLVACLITVLQNHVAIELEVEYQLLNGIFSFKLSVFERVLGEVVCSEGVIGVEGLDDGGIALLSGKLLLVDAGLVVLVHVQQVRIIVHVLRSVLLFDGDSLLSLALVGYLDLLGYFGCFWRHIYE